MGRWGMAGGEGGCYWRLRPRSQSVASAWSIRGERPSFYTNQLLFLSFFNSAAGELSGTQRKAGRKSNMRRGPFKVCWKPLMLTSRDALLGNAAACASITDTSRLMKCHRLPVATVNNGRKTRLPAFYLSNSAHHMKKRRKQRSVEVPGSRGSDWWSFLFPERLL